MSDPKGSEPEDISPLSIKWKPLTAKQREHMKERIRRWKKRDRWNLREASLGASRHR